MPLLDWWKELLARRRESTFPLFIPFGLLWLTFTLAPGLLNLLLSLFETNLITYRFVGLANYQRLISDPYFWKALANSLKYLLVVPPLQLSAISLALLVASLRTGLARFMLSLTYVPVITSVVVTSTAFKLMLADYGLVNQLISGLGLRIGWLSDPRIALFSVMLVTFWRGIGYYSIIYYSAITALPRDVLESAMLDGAGPLTLLLRFVVPMIWPTVMICTLLSSLSAIKVFGEVYVMTRGGPEGATLTLMLYAYQKAFSDLSFGYGAAVSVVLALMSALLSYVMLRIRYRDTLT